MNQTPEHRALPGTKRAGRPEPGSITLWPRFRVRDIRYRPDTQTTPVSENLDPRPVVPQPHRTATNVDAPSSGPTHANPTTPHEEPTPSHTAPATIPAAEPQEPPDEAPDRRRKPHDTAANQATGSHPHPRAHPRPRRFPTPSNSPLSPPQPSEEHPKCSGVAGRHGDAPVRRVGPWLHSGAGALLCPWCFPTSSNAPLSPPQSSEEHLRCCEVSGRHGDAPVWRVGPWGRSGAGVLSRPRWFPGCSCTGLPSVRWLACGWAGHGVQVVADGRVSGSGGFWLCDGGGPGAVAWGRLCAEVISGVGSSPSNACSGRGACGAVTGPEASRCREVVVERGVGSSGRSRATGRRARGPGGRGVWAGLGRGALVGAGGSAGARCRVGRVWSGFGAGSRVRAEAWAWATSFGGDGGACVRAPRGRAKMHGQVWTARPAVASGTLGKQEPGDVPGPQEPGLKPGAGPGAVPGPGGTTTGVPRRFWEHGTPVRSVGACAREHPGSSPGPNPPVGPDH